MERPCLRRHTAHAPPGVSDLPANYKHTKIEGRAQGKRTPVPGAACWVQGTVGVWTREAGCWCGSSHNEMCPALALDRLITSPGRDIETEDDTVTDGVMTCYILGWLVCTTGLFAYFYNLDKSVRSYVHPGRRFVF